MTRGFPILPVNPQREPLYKRSVLLAGRAVTSLRDTCLQVTFGRAARGISQHSAGVYGWVVAGNVLPCRRLLELH